MSHVRESRINTPDAARTRGNQKKGSDGGSGSMKATKGEFASLKDQCLLGAYMRVGVIALGMPNLRGWSYRLCTRLQPL